MKAKITLFFIALSFFCSAQNITFTSPSFKTYLLQANSSNTIAKNLAGNYFDIDSNYDNQIQVSEALEVSYLDIKQSNTNSFGGISNFSNLLYFKASLNNNMNSIDLSTLSNLIEVDCSTNYGLSSLNVSNLTNLQTLICVDNHLINFNITGLTNLQSINCSKNYLTSINVTQSPNLSMLNCSSNDLTVMNILGLTLLTELYCDDNLLASLDLQNYTNLKKLNCNANNISSLNITGILGLEVLKCSSNELYNINVANYSNLKELFCSSNHLENLNLSGLVSLEIFECSNNVFVTSPLDLSGSTNLIKVNCSYCALPSLNLTGLTNLQELNCSANNLSILNMPVSLNLTKLYCNSNSLSNLNLTGFNNLQILNCSSNGLNTLILTGLSNLTRLEFKYNSISTINLSPLSNVTFIECSYNDFFTLDVSSLTNLQELVCTNSTILALNVSGISNLKKLNCSYNNLSTLNISNLINLEEFTCYNNDLLTLFTKNGKHETVFNFGQNVDLKYICADESQLASIQQELSFSMIDDECTANSYCSFTPGGYFETISGTSRFDNNANGCDNNDIKIPNQKFNITNGTISTNVIANISGDYSIPLQNGTYTIAPVLENPTYFNVTPTNLIVTLPNAINPFNQDFCLTPNGIHNDLEVVLIPITLASPGFDAVYKIIYKNKGNTTQSGTLNMMFNDAVSDFVSANPLTSNQAVNSLTWNFTNLLPFETREITIILNLNSPTESPALNSGNVLNYSTSITGQTDDTPIDNSTQLNQNVVNSYDPNDKTCLEGNIVSTSVIGQYVHYIIRFENNGTANATNIVVKDVIDTTKFDINSLIPTHGSHLFETKKSSTNIIEFIFQNINLPFNDANNDGYVAFKIKTKSNLVNGNTFSNKANIYFDYNYPIITNNYISTIQILNINEFESKSKISIYPNPVKDIIQFKTEENILKIEVYDITGRIISTNSVYENKVNLNELKTGNYILKVFSVNGISNARIIKE